MGETCKGFKCKGSLQTGKEVQVGSNLEQGKERLGSLADATGFPDSRRGDWWLSTEPLLLILSEQPAQASFIRAGEGEWPGLRKPREQVPPS